DGFPIGKHPIYTLAFNCPNIPVMNGYLGDSLIRGSHDCIQGRREAEFEWPELAIVIQRKYAAQAWAPLQLALLAPGLATRVRARALIPIERVVRETADGGRSFLLANLRLRQRFYIANNFLQHVDYAEAVLPFLSARLIRVKLSNPQLDFSKATYRE